MTRTAEQRREALGLLAMGAGVREVGRRLDLPPTTVSGWRRALLAEDRQARRLEPGKRLLAHRHPHDTPRPVIGFDLHRTLTPATGFPMEAPYPGVKRAMDRWAGRGACLHITTAALDHQDRELVAVREAMVWAWVREYGLPVGAVLPKPHADRYVDDRMVVVPEDPASVDWDLVAGDVDAMLDVRFAVGEDGLYFRTDHASVGDEVEDWPELADVPADQPRGFSTPTLYVDLHRTALQASGSTKRAEPMPGARDAIGGFYDEGYQVVLGCAGWNPATHDDGDWQHRLAGLIQEVREDGIPYDRIVTVDHNDVRVDDKGFHFTNWPADRPKIAALLAKDRGGREFGTDFSEGDTSGDTDEDADTGCGCCDDCGASCQGDCCDACGQGQDQGPHTGVMVAFFLPESVAQELALDPEEEPTATPADELHLTLVYEGKLDTVPGGTFPAIASERLKRVVAGFAAGAPPIQAQISGLGRFAVGDQVVYASVDAPMLAPFRQRLVDHLKMAGFPISMEHGFTPHVTLGCPDGPAKLDPPEPRRFTFGSLTVCIGEDRADFPLEGVNLTAFAEVRREVDRPDQDDAQRDHAIQAGLEEAQHADVDKARDVAQRVAPGEPMPPVPPGTDEPQGSTTQPIPEDLPVVIDHLGLLAWKRYVNLLRNEVPHHRAVEAVKHIDPDFIATHYHMAKILEAIGRTREPVKFGELPDAYETVAGALHQVAGAMQEWLGRVVALDEDQTYRVMEALLRDRGPLKFGWSPGTVQPPSHVTAVYDQYEMQQEEIAGIAAYLYQLAKEAYLEAINAQLLALGEPIEDAITDAVVLTELEQATLALAQQIVDTFNKDLAAEVYANWIEHRSTLGRQSSLYHLAQEIERWATSRAQWKADQVALDVVGRFYFAAILAFLERNPDLAADIEGWVQPDECVCQACQLLVDGNPYRGDEIATLGLPLHPNCVHDVQIVYSGVVAAVLWRAQAAA